jgi:ATP-binding cassette subfamily B protein
VINVVAFALASLIGSVLLLTAIDGGSPGASGLAGLLFRADPLVPAAHPRALGGPGGARAMVSGQVVDTITNIKTVKLFAHADHEDRAALGAMEGFRQRALDFGVWRRVPVLPDDAGGGAAGAADRRRSLLWQRGTPAEGRHRGAGAIAIRIAQMTGWVSFTLMAIYSNIGEVEDGMRTLTPPHR